MLPGEDPVEQAIRRMGRQWITKENLPRIESQLRGATAIWFIRGPGADLLDPRERLEEFLQQRCENETPIEFPRDPAWSFGTLRLMFFHQCQFLPGD